MQHALLRDRAPGGPEPTATRNLHLHTIRHHGEQVSLEEHYVVSRSQRTRSVLTFFAQDHASTEMVYANADVTKVEQAQEVIAFAQHWQRVAGSAPGLLVFDSKLTTYPVLDELAAAGITFLTLRQRGAKVLEALAAPPASAWRTHNVKRAGRYRHPQISTKRSSTSKASTTPAPDRHPQHRPRPAHPC
jgi:hypothetical protein